MTGYYSIIQYCPDAGRMEAANVGVVLLCEETSFLVAEMSGNCNRERRFFGKGSFDPGCLMASKLALRWRINTAGNNMMSPRKFKHFVDTRGNDIIMTDPRPVTVARPEWDVLDRLFGELVEAKK